MSIELPLDGFTSNRSLEAVSTCLETIGTTRFNQSFIAFAMGPLGADQCMIFVYEEQSARCFLSYNTLPDTGARALAENYILRGHETDPIRARVASRRQADGIDIFPLAALWGEMSESYRKDYFETPGMVDKIAVLARGRGLLLGLNFYRYRESGPYDQGAADQGATLWRIAAQLALLHYSSSQDHSLEDPLLTLSERERETCQWILKGLSTEAIAFEMDLSPNTITTYRKRAYDKLSINSKAALFALCR
ncbi:helix-turn-helix transcriptional regulator [Salipiger sp. P9]|uniref:helix-turn-helix transcriptional regulator n=1 Tax=Salipiger pentaromativorans TaxID=2943193 RepID=UPI002157006B|nr:helix-turn-helix transcriptional regulator [Salipiger pentaromativorans]MCR8548878.1 helix-turn-helix transcriptional regulator [Salipiger pentaromativorans]